MGVEGGIAHNWKAGAQRKRDWRDDRCPPKRGNDGACRVEDKPGLGSDPRGRGPGYHRSLWGPLHGASSPTGIGGGCQQGGVGGNRAGRKQPAPGRESPTSAGVRRGQADLPAWAGRVQQSCPPAPRPRAFLETGRKAEGQQRAGGGGYPGLLQEFARLVRRENGVEEVGNPRCPCPGSVRRGGSCAGHRSASHALGPGWESPAGRGRREPWRRVQPGRPCAAGSSLLGSDPRGTVFSARGRETECAPSRRCSSGLDRLGPPPRPARARPSRAARQRQQLAAFGGCDRRVLGRVGWRGRGKASWGGRPRRRSLRGELTEEGVASRVRR